MDDAGSVQVPKLAAVVSQKQVAAGGHGPRTADAVETGCQRGEAITAAVSGAITGQDDLRAIRMYAVRVICATIASNDVSSRFNEQVAQFGEAGGKRLEAARGCPTAQLCAGAEISQRFVVSDPDATPDGDGRSVGGGHEQGGH